MEKFIKSDFYEHNLDKTSGAKNDKFHKKFILEPVNRGFANTIGNAMRRTLLSNTLAAAVYAIEIKGAKHEFTAIDNVKEDVVEIILNLKQLAIKFNHDSTDLDDNFVFTLKSKKTGKVTAGDIVTPAGFDIVNTKLQIASISKADALDMKLHVRIDVGFKSFEENRIYMNKNGDKGFIPIDSNFTPITLAKYNVGKYQVGADKEQEKVELEVQTNGTIKPEDAISFSAKILMSYFESFYNLGESNKLKDMEINKKIKEYQSEDYKLKYAISELNLSARSFNSLKQANIETLNDLVGKSVADLENIKNLGRKSLIEIVKEAKKQNIEIIGSDELLEEEGDK